MPHTRNEILAIGKQIADKFFHKKHQEEATIKGWATRDEGSVWIMISPWTHKPQKLAHIWDRQMSYCSIKFLDFPSVQWSDEEPTPVTLTIKTDK